MVLCVATFLGLAVWSWWRIEQLLEHQQSEQQPATCAERVTALHRDLLLQDWKKVSGEDLDDNYRVHKWILLVTQRELVNCIAERPGWLPDQGSAVLTELRAILADKSHTTGIAESTDQPNE